MVKKTFLSDFVLCWLKGGTHCAANRSETMISVINDQNLGNTFQD